MTTMETTENPLSGCDHCEIMQEGVETYLVYLEITAEERSMKLCPACFGRAEEIGIKIIRPLS